MRRIVRAAAITAAAVLVAGALPATPAAAAHTEIRLSSMANGEYHKSCTDTEPFTCGTFGNTMFFMVQVWNRPKPFAPITVTYEIDSGTAVAGQDFVELTSGSVTIPTNAFQDYVVVRTVVDTEVEPTETFSVRLTGASISATLVGSPTTGTIFDGGGIPLDCDLDRADLTTVSMTCTDRPASQTWRHRITCGSEFPTIVQVAGNEVTGNGTSTAQCTQFTYSSSSFVNLA